MNERMPAPVSAISGVETEPAGSSSEKKGKGSTRRAFLGQVGGAAAATIASTAVTAGPLASSSAAAQSNAQPNAVAEFGNNSAYRQRAIKCFNNRLNAARAGLNTPIPKEISNGDENRFPNRIGNFSKGLIAQQHR